MVVMPAAQSQMKSASNDAECAQPLDLYYFGFTHADAYRALECLGESGRTLYRKVELREDAVYPISYGLFLSFSLFLLASDGGLRRKRWLLAFLPWMAVAFDFMENHYIVLLIDQFPQLGSDIVRMASIGNQLKWFFAAFSVLLLLWVATVSAIRLMRER